MARKSNQPGQKKTARNQARQLPAETKNRPLTNSGKNTATGPLENPGVGTGEIVAELDGDDLILDFVEFWHSPPKHNPYTGSKI